MSDPIRFYFDQHIPKAVAHGLRRRGVDVLTTQDVERCSQSDLEQILFSTQENRVFVTFDDDLLRLASQGLEHAGIVFCSASKYSIGELIYALLLVYDVLNPEDFQNHIEFL